MELENEKPWNSDFCGHCRQCIDSCPTKAITEDREVISSRCISYWTIEAKSLPPENLRPLLGDWLFGCDLCQTSCPWNQKKLAQQVLPETTSSIEQKRELRRILESSRKQLQKEFHQTPLSRVAGWKLQRNAIVVATNLKYVELTDAIARWQHDEKLGPLVEWSLQTLGPTQKP
jgi:epoxyqueuosine reductase